MAEQKKQKKGILKHAQENLQQEKQIQWDEQGIAEHDKQRGQYPKINEPKTPYNYNEGSDHEMAIEEEQKEPILPMSAIDDEKLKQQYVNTIPQKQPQNDLDLMRKKDGKLDLAALNAKLEQQAKDLGISKESDEEKRANKEKHEKFMQKRQEHYKVNLQALRQQMEDEDDEK